MSNAEILLIPTVSTTPTPAPAVADFSNNGDWDPLDWDTTA